MRVWMVMALEMLNMQTTSNGAIKKWNSVKE